VFKPHPKVTIQDQAIGIQQCLLCFDFMLVAVAFLFAYRNSEYRELKKSGKGRPMNIFLAAANALNPLDLFTGGAYAIRLLLSGVGPRGNGTWGRSGGYEKVRDSNAPPFDISTAYAPSSNSNMRMGRVNYQRPLSTDLGAAPPTYDDTRPLRSSSPAPYGASSPYRGRSPSPSAQNYYPYHSDAQTGSPPRKNDQYLNPDYDPNRPSYEG
jgi:hypothetical protein